MINILNRFLSRTVLHVNTVLTCYFLTSGLLDNVTVLIGVAYGGRPIAGVINQPFYNYQVQTKLNAPAVVSYKLLSCSSVVVVNSDFLPLSARSRGSFR